MFAPEHNIGDSVLVLQDAGRGQRARTPAVVTKVCAKRYKVYWLDAAIGHAQGTESYVPHWSVVKDTRLIANMQKNDWLRGLPAIGTDAYFKENG